jgi:hypothetical protein
VNRNETIGFEEIEELVKEVIQIVANEAEEVMDVVMIESLDTTALLGYVVDNVASHTPQAQNAEESSSREAAAQKNVVDGEETALEQLDRCDLEVATYGMVDGGEKFD